MVHGVEDHEELFKDDELAWPKLGWFREVPSWQSNRIRWKLSNVQEKYVALLSLKVEYEKDQEYDINYKPI